MAADPSIYNALLQPVKSAQQYAEEYAAADSARVGRKLNALQLQAAQQSAADDQSMRNALAGLQPDATLQDRTAALRRVPSPKAWQAADTLQNADLERQGKQATIDKEKAAAAKSTWDLQKARMDWAWQAIGSAPNAQVARDLIAQGVQAGHLDQAGAQTSLAELQQIGQDPRAYAEWRQRNMLKLMNAKDQFEAFMKDREFALRSQNELIGPDGQVNQPLFTAKKQLAQAGKTQVNLNVNTAKGLTGEMATGLGKQLDASLAGAQSAVNTINTADQIDSALSSGKLIIGPMADKRIVLARLGDALGVGGADNPEKLANTASLIQSLAKNELDAAQSMKGQGQITEAERALLRRASSGDINMSAPELQALTGALRKTAQRRIEQHQAQVNRLSSLEGAAPLIPFYQVDMPKSAQAGGGGVIRFDASGKRIN